MSEHIAKQFDADLDALRAHLTRMGGLVEEQVRNALRAFVESDRNLIESVISGDERVDEMEVAIDGNCSQLIARRQPTAVDLRMVLAVGKAVTDLERIGDEAKKIARTTSKILERGIGELALDAVQIRTMGERTTTMLHEVLDAFVRHDTRMAARIVRLDREIDQHFRAIMRQLITYMMEDPRTITTAIDIIFIAKSVERIGDHCKNIAEDVIYIALGRDVRHIGLEALEREVNIE